MRLRFWHIREVPGSKLGFCTDLSEILRGFSQFLEAKSRTVPCNKHNTLVESAVINQTLILHAVALDTDSVIKKLVNKRKKYFFLFTYLDWKVKKEI
jgi:hypothetical protein